MSWEPVYRLIKKNPARARNNLWRGGQGAAHVGWCTCRGIRHGRNPPWAGYPVASRAGSGGRIRVPEPYAAKQRRLLETEGVVVGRLIDMKIYGWSFRKVKAIKASKHKRPKTR